MSTSPDPRAGRAAVRAGVVGNYVDQLHIFAPLVALAPAMATITGAAAAAAASGWAIMATLLGRPLGAVVFGRWADRVGRTRVTRVAIVGTAASALAIAALPDHRLLGGGTLVALLALRFAGGVFLAGEYSAAVPLAMEWSGRRRRGLVSGLIMAMAPVAQASVAVGVVVGLAALGPAAYGAWGWRVPFAVAGLASLGLWLAYRRVSDQPAVTAARARTRALSARWPRSFWPLFALMSGLWILTNLTVVVLPTRLPRLGLDGGAVAGVMALAAAAQAAAMVLAGALSSRAGRRPTLIGWGLLAAAAAPVLWWGLFARGLPVAAGAALLQVVTVSAYGPVGAYLSESFAAPVRSTAYGAAYSLSIVGPALHPAYLPALARTLGDGQAVMTLLVLGGLLVAFGAAAGPREPASGMEAG